MLRRINITGLLLAALLLCAFGARATTYTAASCSAADAAKCWGVTGGSCSPSGTAVAGDTVNVPAGTCTWTAGVTPPAGVKIVGAGAGRVIATDLESTALTIGTGTKVWNNLQDDTKIDTNSTNCGGATNTPCLDTLANSVITNGETLRIMETGWDGNFMQGTVISYSGGVLTMNITSSGGTCGQADSGMPSNCKRWIVTTLPTTILCNNLTGGTMFALTESASFDTTLTGLFFGNEHDPRCSGVTDVYDSITLAAATNGLPILIHDNFFEREDGGNGTETIDSGTDRGVIWNNSFIASPFSLTQDAAIREVDNGGSTFSMYNWTHVADWGNTDTNENQALYFETNDVHAYNVGLTDCDSGCKMVFRYNVVDNCSMGSHGADTGPWGMRTIEIYDNVGLWHNFGDRTSAALSWWFNERGGTSVIHDNNFPLISGDYSSNDLSLDVYVLQRATAGGAGNACWGAGFTTPGQYYHAPRQTGFGYVTGTGTAAYTSIAGNPTINVSGANDSVGYVGDSEPVYVWNNSRTLTFAFSSGSGGVCNSPDTVTNYIVLNRDYFSGTAKPGYTPAAYPNPYTGSQPSSTPVAPTPMIMTADNVAQYLFGAPLPRGR